jgi:hypothetical protein
MKIRMDRLDGVNAAVRYLRSKRKIYIQSECHADRDDIKLQLAKHCKSSKDWMLAER